MTDFPLFLLVFTQLFLEGLFLSPYVENHLHSQTQLHPRIPYASYPTIFFFMVFIITCHMKYFILISVCPH